MLSQKILGVKIHSISENDIKELLHTSSATNFIATVNAAFLVECVSNKNFSLLLTKTQINTCDSISIQMASVYVKLCDKYKGPGWLKLVVFLFYGFRSVFLVSSSSLKRMTGVAICNLILNNSNNAGSRVIIFHNKLGLTSTKKLRGFITHNYPKIDLVICPISAKEFNLKLQNKYTAGAILCTFGQYKQEAFLYANRRNLNAKVLVGVGGAFDVITSNNKMYHTVTKYGLEWIVRLINNPKRFTKIFNSVVVFPFLVYKNSLNVRQNNKKHV